MGIEVPAKKNDIYHGLFKILFLGFHIDFDIVNMPVKQKCCTILIIIKNYLILGKSAQAGMQLSGRKCITNKMILPL